MDWYLAVWKKYAVFSGRARRKEYWFFTLFNMIAIIVLAIVDHLFGTVSAHSGTGLFGGIYALAALIPGLAVAVRRLHDTDRSGWWLLIAFIPLIGALVLLYFMVQDSQEEQNQYGPNPKGAEA